MAPRGRVSDLRQIRAGEILISSFLDDLQAFSHHLLAVASSDATCLLSQDTLRPFLGVSGNYGACPGHDDKTPSLSIRDSDDGRVLVYCHAGCSQNEVIDSIASKGLWPANATSRMHSGRRRAESDNHSRQVNTVRQAPSSRFRKMMGPGEEQRIAWALKIWKASQPICGTNGERYFRHRAITIPIPASIKFASALKHSETGLLLPAIVAGGQNGDGQISAIQRTFLKLDGTGKSRVSKPKMALGVLRGGAVRLGPAESELGIAEGVENSLSAMQLHPGLSVWCALSVSSLANMVIPDDVEELHLFLDGDEPGSPAAKAAAKAALVHLNSGRKVNIWRPPIGKDWNDLVREGSYGVSAMGGSDV